MDESLKNFDEVWERVMEGKADSPACQRAKKRDEAEVLRELMDAEERSAELYSALSRKTRGAAQKLRCIANDEREHLRSLQALHFLIAGDSYHPEPSCPIVDGVLDAVRESFMAEKEAARRYQEEAEATELTECAEVYRQNGYEETHHAEVLRGLVEKML